MFVNISAIDNYLALKIEKILEKLQKTFTKSELKAFVMGMKVEKALSNYRGTMKAEALMALLKEKN